MESVTVIIWVILSVIVLIHASLCDIRSREVPDWHWAVLGGSGAILCAVSSAGSQGTEVVAFVLAGAVMLLIYMLTDMPKSVQTMLVVASLAIYIAPCTLYPGDEYALGGMASMVAFFLVYGMYEVGLLRGGADAKCLMALALSFPVYPDTPWTPVLWHIGFPESLVFSVPVSVLVVGLALSLLSVFPLLAMNIRRGDAGRRMLTTYVMPVSEARASHVWPVEHLVDGRLVPCRPCEDRLEALGQMEGAGIKHVRVTPMIPFVLPLAVAFIIVVSLGSPLALLIGARSESYGRNGSICLHPAPRCPRGIPGG